MNKILFLPVDINLKEFAFKQYDSSVENSAFNPYWNSSFISNDCIEKNNFKYVLDQLPFTRITRIIHKIQRVRVGPHVDVMTEMKLEDGEYKHFVDNEPCGYRIVINGSPNKLKVYNGQEWVIANLPNTPCCYLLNSTSGLHKVDADDNREVIYIRGYIDPVKHKEIIDRSILKFAKTVIYASS